MRFLGELGGKRPPPPTPPQEAAAAPASPTRTPPRDPISPRATLDDDSASSDSESELDSFSFHHHSVDELAAFGVVDVGMYLAPTIPNFDTYMELGGPAFVVGSPSHMTATTNATRGLVNGTMCLEG